MLARRIVLLGLALVLSACAASEPYLTAAPFAPTPSPVVPTSTATPAWWGTVTVEMQTPLPTLVEPTVAGGALGSASLSPLPVPSGFPSLLATVTPVAYESLTGKIIFRTRQEGFERLYVMGADGSDRKPLYPKEQDFLGTLGQSLFDQALNRQVMSPDGGYQVYVQDAWGRAQLYIKRLSDGATWALTKQGAGIAYDPAWQPTGDLIVFVSSESGNDEIWTVRSNGTDARQLTHNSWEWDKYPSWSPDGKQIVFWSNREGRKQIYVMNADGTGQHNISNSPYDDYDPVWVR